MGWMVVLAMAGVVAAPAPEPVDYWKVKLPKPGTEAWEQARQELLELRQRDYVAAREGWTTLTYRADDRWKIWDQYVVGGPVGAKVGTQSDFDGDQVWDWKDLCPSLPEDTLPDHLDDLYGGDAADGCPNNGRPETYRPGDMGRRGEGLISHYGEAPWTDEPGYAALVEALRVTRAGEVDRAEVLLAEAVDHGVHENLVNFVDQQIDSYRRSQQEAREREAAVVQALAAAAAAEARARAQASAETPPPPSSVGPPPTPVAPSWPSVDGRLTGSARHPQDAAVVVGIADYLRLPDVPYADRDAEAFRTWAVYGRGIPLDRVTSITAPASRDHIEEAVRRAGAMVGPGGVVWVYFAGHGAADPASGARMILGDDAAADLTSFTARGLTLDAIEAHAAAGGGRPVLIVDACFTGVGRDGGELLAGKRFAVPTYATTRVATSVQWNAAGPGQASGPMEAVQHGAFTYWTLGALRGWADGELTGQRDGVVTGEEAQAYVERALRAAQVHDQRPVWLGPGDVALSEGLGEEGPPL